MGKTISEKILARASGQESVSAGDIIWANVDRAMMDDILGPRPDDPLNALLREDLDRLSVAELEARVAALDGEIARCRRKIEYAVNHRASADALFRK